MFASEPYLTLTPFHAQTYCEEESDDVTCAKLLLRIIRTILFGDGRPRYGQTPPIGGILLQDILKAGAFVGGWFDLSDGILEFSIIFRSYIRVPHPPYRTQSRTTMKSKKSLRPFNVHGNWTLGVI